MLRCTLFGQAITFHDPAERFFDLQYAGWTAQSEAKQRFLNWYGKCGDIGHVLQGYKGFAQSLLNDLAVQPLFSSLRRCDIYDVSKDAYYASCVDYTETEHALNFVKQQCTAIRDKRDAAAEYRGARKASRGRWQGGGFGLSGAIKGAAMAGGMNLLSGMGHSMVNAIGNAGSSMEASSALHKLYTQEKTREILFNALVEDMLTIFSAHIDLVNARKPGYISESFEPERAEALFENAKAIADKRRELLVQAMSLCPWNTELVQYIFVNYPEERGEISVAAHRFHIDLSETFEALLEKEYPEEARSSEEAAQKAKSNILGLMAEYHIEESATLDRLEKDCMERLCSGFETADKAACLSMQECLNRYGALEKNKAPYLEQVKQRLSDIWNEELSALCSGYERVDEAACNRMKDAIRAHDAPEELKEAFLSRLQQRIEEIWSAEDGALFEKLYLNTDITDSAAVKKTLEEVKQAARTSASERYISALETCTEKDIHMARIFQRGIRPKLYAVIGWTIFLLGVSNLFFLHLGILATILCVMVSVIFFALYTGLSTPWEKLTLKGTVFPSALTVGLSQRKTGIPSFVVALLLAVVLSFLGSLILKADSSDPTPPVSESAQTQETDSSLVDSPEEASLSPLPEQGDSDELLMLERLEYMVTGTDGNSYNRYLGSDYQVYWYYDHTVDEAGTAELLAACPDQTNLYTIFDYAIYQGIDANDYLSAHSDDPDANIASDPTNAESTTFPEPGTETISAAIASVLPVEIGTFRTGTGLIDDEEDPGYVRVSQCELISTDPAIFDLSSVTAELLLRWSESHTWEVEDIQFNGSVRLDIEGNYTVSSFSQERSADITMGSDATLNPDGSLTFPGVTIHSGDYVENGNMIVEVMDNPDMAVATKETGSIYCGYTTDSKFFLYFDASMIPTFFSYDP